MSTNIIMPEMGEGVIEGTIVTWLKHEGEPIIEDEPILEIETDKVTVEVLSEASGVLLKACVNEGETVPVGTVLAVVGQEGEEIENNGMSDSTSTPQKTKTPDNSSATVSDADTPSITPAKSPTVAPTKSVSRDIEGTRISPVVARMLAEHELDIRQINGTGRDGRVTKHDVLDYLKYREQDEDVIQNIPEVKNVSETRANAISVTPKRDTQMPTNGEIVPLSGMRRAIADHMVMSKSTSPHVTTVFEFDYANVAKHRTQHKPAYAKDGIKLTYMPYLVLATANALKKHPFANAMWTDDGIRLKPEINIGIAVAMDKGLLVPVIRNADAMNLRGLSRAINGLADRARNNKLMPQELQGGTFSITNHGASGSIIGTPIINQPQVGILGIGMIEKRVKVINDAIAIRPCAYVSFSFDHRILDGATADAFVMDIKHQIENFSE